MESLVDALETGEIGLNFKLMVLALLYFIFIGLFLFFLAVIDE